MHCCHFHLIVSVDVLKLFSSSYSHKQKLDCRQWRSVVHVRGNVRVQESSGVAVQFMWSHLEHLLEPWFVNLVNIKC